MKVECKISDDYKEPYAILHINKITPAITEIISILENESSQTQPLTMTKERKTYFIKSEELSLVRSEGREIVCYDQQKNRYVLDKPLYEWERILGVPFVRISKFFLILSKSLPKISLLLTEYTSKVIFFTCCIFSIESLTLNIFYLSLNFEKHLSFT